jgi:hypothetical protein
MALFGRSNLPHRSRALVASWLMSIVLARDSFRTLFEQRKACGWTKASIGGIFDRQGRHYVVFDVDATRQAARQRALPCDPTFSTRSVGQATQGVNEGKWYAPARPLSKCTLANGSAPMGAKGMGIIAVNLPRLSAPLPPSFSPFAFPSEVALVRLDGQYGDAVVMAETHSCRQVSGDTGKRLSVLGVPPEEAASWLIHLR